MESTANLEGAVEIEHTYAFLKTGGANRYLKFADEWGGFFIDFRGIPLSFVLDNYNDALIKHPSLSGYRKSFLALQEIFTTSLAQWRAKVRLAVWNREECGLEIWEITGQLRPFPRQFMANLYDKCTDETALSRSKEWKLELKAIEKEAATSGAQDYSIVLDYLSGDSGYRILPARRIGSLIPSESIYAPIDTLSVLQELNWRTFKFMTKINPPGTQWPEGIFGNQTVFVGPAGTVMESGYGRFVREYLDGVIDPNRPSILESLTRDQRVKLVCATLNPILVETAATLFALDIGMVIDSGPGKGRQGVDVVACCGNITTPERILARLQDLGISLHAEAADHLRETGVIAFQCKANRDHSGLSAKRLVEFRPMDLESAVQSSGFRGISTQQALALADYPQRSGLQHLHAWLDRMCDIVVRRR